MCECECDTHEHSHAAASICTTSRLKLRSTTVQSDSTERSGFLTITIFLTVKDKKVEQRQQTVDRIIYGAKN